MICPLALSPSARADDPAPAAPAPMAGGWHQAEASPTDAERALAREWPS